MAGVSTDSTQWFADLKPRTDIKIEHVPHSTNASSFFMAGENHLLGLAISDFVNARFFSFESRFPLEDGLEVKIKSENPRADLKRAAQKAAAQYRKWRSDATTTKTEA